jgi:transposase
MSVKNKKPKRKFTKEFKQEAVNLVLVNGMKQSEVSKDLGVSYPALGRWILESKAERKEAFPGNGKLKSSDQILRDLEAENKRLRMERDLLKKAMAYFVDAPK